jgi:hypothetical protein
MKRLLLIAPFVALAVSCGQQVSVKGPQAIETVSLPIGATPLSAQATIIDESGITITPNGTDYVVDTKRNARYVYALFNIKNNTGAALNNLTFYAINKAGNEGGTAIKTLTNFGGGDAGVYAQGAQPGHKMQVSGGAAATVDTANAGLQLFSATEAGALTGAEGTVLEYGFRLNEPSLADGATGTVSIGYRLPGNTASSFYATFAVAKDGPNRVSQSAEENPSDVIARVGSAAEIAYLGPKGQDSVNVPAPGTTLAFRFANIKTGTSAYLLSEYAFASFLNGSSLAQGPYIYGEGYNSTENFACTSGNGCVVAQGYTANGYSAGVTLSGAASGGIKAIARPFNFNAQNLSKYKKLRIFARVSSGTTANLDFETNGSTALRYQLTGLTDALAEYTVDLMQPQCAPTCTTANITTSLTSVKGIVLEKFAGSNTNVTVEMGNVVFFDYQP